MLEGSINNRKDANKYEVVDEKENHEDEDDQINIHTYNITLNNPLINRNLSNNTSGLNDYSDF